MPHRIRWTRRWRRARGHALPVVVACALVLLATGFLPGPGMMARLGMGRLLPGSGERYPCEGGECSCDSAERCWTSCCCHTMAQRIAWARREGVAIPAWVNVDAAGEGGQAPACPLCEQDDAGSPETGGEIAQVPSGCPTMSPMGCMGLDLLIAVAGVRGVVRGSWCLETSPEVGVVWCESSARPEPALAETPTPPPRVTAA